MDANNPTDERNVQRFSGWGIAMMQEKPTAGYVLASDYDALAAEIERLQLLAADYGGQLTAAKAEIARLRSDIAAMSPAYRESLEWQPVDVECSGAQK